MRLLLSAALLVAVSAIAQDDPYKTGDDLQAVVKAKCAEGCVVFSREEAAQLEETLNKILARRMQEAFAGGVQHQKQACASLVSL